MIIFIILSINCFDINVLCR